MKLVLVRHGRAIDRDDPRAPAEAERWLTKDGAKRTREVARGFAKLGIVPDALLSSPWLRARETAAIFATELGFPEGRIQTTRALLPGAAPSAIIDELRALDERTVACFGHAPHLDRVVARLLGAKRSAALLKKAGLAALDVRSLHQPHAILDFVLTPAICRRIS